MREIEIKVKVADNATILATLAKQGIAVSKPVTHHDRVFGVPGENGGTDKPAPWLRIRTETKDGMKTHYFTLKKSVTSQMDSIEHETIVEDDVELEKIIQHINFTPYSDLTKTRQKAKMGDIELCIDTVDGLGDFVEVEKITDEDADYETVAAELWAVLDSLEVSREDLVTDGYDVLMNKKLGRE
jgi:adenylate cyclase class 2